MRVSVVLAVVVALAGCAAETGLRGEQKTERMPVALLEVAPAAHDFGALGQGQTSEQRFILSNPGDGDLTVESVTVVGDQSFSLTPLQLPLTLVPGGEHPLDIVYTAEDMDEVADLVIVSNADEDPTITVPMNGTWARPAVCVDPEPIQFAEIPPLCDEQVTVVIESCGTGPLTVEQIRVQTDALGVGLTDRPELPAVLDPGDSVAVAVTWAPEEEGPMEGLLVVTSDAPEEYTEVPVTGTATEGLLCDGVQLYELEMPAEYKLADVAFLISVDKTSTHLAPALASDLTEIAADIRGTLPDVTFGVATFRGYESFGYSMYPFELGAQQTTELSLVTAALGDVGYAGWDNGYTTTWEAIYQAASGKGYDMDCDRSLDGASDVRPFIASPVDAFFGLVMGTFDPLVPGTGGEGGMGFRDGVLPIFVVVMHGRIRDPGMGHETPDGCAFDADMIDAHGAVAELGGKFIGIKGISFPDYPETIDQLEAFAIITDSYADMDGDYSKEPAVTTWDGDTEAFAKIVSDAVVSLAGNATFDVIELRLDDPHGAILSVSPEFYSDVQAGEPLPFTLQIEGVVVDVPTTSTIEATVELVADDSIVLSRKVLYIEQ